MRLVVLEVNELPKRVVDWWVEERPGSPLARLVRSGTLAEAVNRDELPRDLYPSQSWATTGMGVPYLEHEVFWYADPKPAQYPFYWQAAADAGRSVGTFGVLHSAAFTDAASHPQVRFMVPDVFDDGPAAVPANLAPLHELNLRLTKQSARVAAVRPSLRDVHGFASFARHGVRPATVARVGRLAVDVARGNSNKERLRVAQSLLMADVFERQVRRTDPDLAVLFLNHVASIMHRYWAATFSDDWSGDMPYDEEWVAQNSGELAFAMEWLDLIIDRLVRLTESTGRGLLIATSMGQKADLTVDTSMPFQAVVRDPESFLAAIGVQEPVEFRRGMVPQFSVDSDQSAVLDRFETALASFIGEGITRTMRSGNTVTVSYDLETDGELVWCGAQAHRPADIGVTIERVSDHRSGRHCPRGLLISSRSMEWPSELDALDVAPTILDLLDVEALDHHRRWQTDGVSV